MRKSYYDWLRQCRVRVKKLANTAILHGTYQSFCWPLFHTVIQVKIITDNKNSEVIRKC